MTGKLIWSAITLSLFLFCLSRRGLQLDFSTRGIFGLTRESTVPADDISTHRGHQEAKQATVRAVWMVLLLLFAYHLVTTPSRFDSNFAEWFEETAVTMTQWLILLTTASILSMSTLELYRQVRILGIENAVASPHVRKLVCAPHTSGKATTKTLIASEIIVFALWIGLWRLIKSDIVLMVLLLFVAARISSFLDALACPGVLLLAASRPTALTLQAKLRTAAYPLRVVSMLRQSESDDPGVEFFINNDILRSSTGDCWQESFRALAGASPIVILDSRVTTTPLLYEATYLRNAQLGHKVLYLIDPQQVSPSYDSLDSFPNRLTEEALLNLIHRITRSSENLAHWIFQARARALESPLLLPGSRYRQRNPQSGE